MRLLNLTLTSPISVTTSTPMQVRDEVPTLLAQCAFTYGSGGVSADAYLQTSIDGGASWIDIANWHWTTTSGKSVCNLSSNTVITTFYTPTDGSLASNTCKDGVLGSQFRVKYQSSGTYAGGTTLTVDVAGNSGGLAGL
jgi:hypothetical protein